MINTTKLNGKNTVIVAVDTEAKTTHTVYGTDGKVNLFLRPDCSEDGRRHNFTFGEVVGGESDKVSEGDIITFHHNATAHTQELFLKDILNGGNDREGRKYFRIQEDLILTRYRNGEIQPIFPTCLVYRLYDPPMTSESGIIISLEKKKRTNMVMVAKLPAEMDDLEGQINVGDVLEVYKMSDYEINFKHNGTNFNMIKINLNRDVMGVNELWTKKMKEDSSQLIIGEGGDKILKEIL